MNPNQPINISNEPKIVMPTEGTFLSRNWKKLTIGLILILVASISIYLYIRSTKTQLVTTRNNTNNLPDINPGDLGYQVYSPATTSNTNSNNGEDFSENEYSGLFHVWPKEVSAFKIVEESVNRTIPDPQNASATKEISQKLKTVYFQDKETGMVYKAFEPLYEVNKLTDTSITDIDFASFSRDGKSFANVNSKGNLFVFDTKGVKTASLDTKSFVDTNVLGVYEGSGNSNFVYIKSSSLGSTIRNINVKTGEVSTLIDIPLTDYTLKWTDTGILYLITNPSYLYPQQVLKVDTSKQKLVMERDDILLKTIFPNGLILASNQEVLKGEMGRVNSPDVSGFNTFSSKCFTLTFPEYICAGQVFNGDQ
jgi:hypothetical protein